jgi:hypothetical protein
MAIPGAYAPTSIAVWVTGTRKPLLHDKAVVLKEDVCVTDEKFVCAYREHPSATDEHVPKIVNHIWLQQMMKLSKCVGNIFRQLPFAPCRM